MFRAIIGFTLASSLLAAGFAPAIAQSAPQGSYQQTCRNARVAGSRLDAQCPNEEGTLVSSSIDLGSCQNGDIANVNGNLRCMTSVNNTGRNGDRYDLPAGPYQQSCNGAVMQGSTLNANCRAANGTTLRSSLDLNSCRGADVANINGNLRCLDNTSNGNFGPPRGSYQQSCNSTSLQGKMLSATCSNPNGQPITSSLDTNSCRSDSDIVNLNGRLACGFDAPSLPAQNALTLRTVRPENNATVETRRPMIEAQFGQTQADPNTVHVVLDGRDVSNESSRSASGIVFSPRSDLQSGQHTIHVAGRDANGRPFDQAWQFTTGTATITNFIDNLQPLDNATVTPSFVVTGYTAPNSQVIVQVGTIGNDQLTVSGAIGQILGIGPSSNAVRVETAADANGVFSVRITIGAGSGQQLGLVVDSTEPRTQAAARARRTLVVR
jgi:hypothetical protein